MLCLYRRVLSGQTSIQEQEQNQIQAFFLLPLCPHLWIKTTAAIRNACQEATGLGSLSVYTTSGRDLETLLRPPALPNCQEPLKRTI